MYCRVKSGRFEIKGIIPTPFDSILISLPGFKMEKMGESPIEDEEADRGDLIINSNTGSEVDWMFHGIFKKSRKSPIDLNLFNRLRPN